MIRRTRTVVLLGFLSAMSGPIQASAPAIAATGKANGLGLLAKGSGPSETCRQGQRYLEGDGVTRDTAEAAKWFRQAAERGGAPCQLALAALYAQGLGVMQNPTETARWTRLAAENGHAQAMNNLGTLLAEGRGTAIDKVEAMKWFSLAATLGNGPARRNRDTLAAQLSPAEMAEAERQASAWRAAHEGS